MTPSSLNAQSDSYLDQVSTPDKDGDKNIYVDYAAAGEHAV